VRGQQVERVNERVNKPILHLICGLPGSGKTTLAKQIEESLGAIRFCPDQWIKSIWPRETAETEGNAFRDQIEQLQWKLGKKILTHEIDVIIEWGTWGKSEREKLRDEAWAIGAQVKFYYLVQPREVLKERLLNRNTNLPTDEFATPEEGIDAFLDACYRSIQVPDEDELKTYNYLG
jgi:predicted kinase